MDLARRTVPTAAKKPAKKTSFIGLKKFKLSNGKFVRDSPAIIRAATDRLMNNHKRTVDANGWPEAELIEKTASKKVSQPKVKTATVVEDGLVVIGHSMLPNYASEVGELQMPDDLRMFSTEEVSRWTVANLEDCNLAARFVRSGVTGQTLAAIRDNKQDIVGRLNMLG